MDETIYQNVYRLGRLRKEDIEEWLDFVHFVFHRERSYFEEHLKLDPHMDLNLIFIARYIGTKENTQTKPPIVATIRVFVRNIMMPNGEEVFTGGIGEVSTHPDHCRKGLASKLLELSIEEMKTREMKLSTLHGDQTIYTKAGFVKVDRSWCLVSSPSRIPDSINQEDWVLSISEFNDESKLKEIQPAYHDYISNYFGCFTRHSSEYWRQWIQKLSSQSVSIYEKRKDGKLAIAGLLSADIFKDKIDVKDFFVSRKEMEHDGGWRAYCLMIHYWKNLFAKERMNEEVVVPLPIAKKWSGSNGVNYEAFRSYSGCQYLHLANPNGITFSNNSCFNEEKLEISVEQHLFMRVDDF